MNTLTRPLVLTVTLALLLASCTRAISTEVPSPISTAPLSQLVTIELTVQADTSVPLNAVGQVINFKYNVRNAGSTSTPGPVTVTGATCTEINTVGNLDNALDVNETVTCTGSYTITQADLDRGSVTNVATANVYGINSSPVTTSVPLARTAVLTLATSANPQSFDRVGQTITYTYVITNTGAAALGPAQFTISDDPVGPVIPCGDANTTLAAGASLTCTATFVIPEPLDSIKNTATASGGGASTSAPASTTITRSSSPAVNLVAGSTIQHTVVAGEWLWQIARCYGADPIRVRDQNRRALVAGTTVTVPNIGSVGTIHGPPCVEAYTVQSGDTWNSIAQKFNADPRVLQKANPGALSVGRQLKIPRNSAGTNVPGMPSGKVQVGEQSTTGGKAGTPLNIKVRFEASSPSGAVTEMRVKQFSVGTCLPPEQMNDAAWETFVAEKTYAYTPPINWSTFKLHVQYRDARGNVSPVYCGEVAVEGMP